MASEARYGRLSGGSDGPSLQALAPFIAEFVGTFVLVTTVGSALLTGASPEWAATAIGFVLMAQIYSLGKISGAHFNPAVSFALCLWGAIDFITVLGYWLAQISAGVAAGFFVSTLYGGKVEVMPQNYYTTTAALGAELLYTAILAFVVSSVAASKRNNPDLDQNQFYGLAIGFVILAGGYAAGPISGAAFNPAVVWGLAVSGQSYYRAIQWTVAELLGSVVAAVFFKLVHQPNSATQPATLFQKLWSEFLGTFILVTTVGLNLVNGSPVTPWSAAAALAVSIYSLGSLSGAHFNPAVTLAVLATGRGVIPLLDAILYVPAQLLGAVAASGVIGLFHSVSPQVDNTLGVGPGYGFAPMQANLAEFVATAVLAFTVVSIATTQTPNGWATKQNFFFGLAISACVVAGGFSIGNVSGGVLNPAVAVGITVEPFVHTGQTEAPPLLGAATYILWELAGGLVAALAFRLTHPKEFKAVLIVE